jgi:erythromycin esterase-like protein
MQVTEASLAGAIRARARPLTGGDDDYDALLELIGDAGFVLLGEASHGTHEFYRERARITQRLIAERGFAAVAIEGDWPDAHRVNRYVRAAGHDEFALDALGEFKRFPTWMWRNTDVVDFVDWLRDWNDRQPTGGFKVGFYGLDLYSLHSSMRAVLRYLDKVDPEAAKEARARYACFDHFGEDTHSYGFLTRMGAESCKEEAVRQLLELERHALEQMQRDGAAVEEDAFHAEQNARLVRNAEEYYRSMFLRGVSTWNLRDRHMVETLEALVAFLERRMDRAKVVVWAHNSHLGDARATEMGRSRGELNVGQLVREAHGRDCFNVGFTTHAGTVTAASDWDEPAERKRVRPSRRDSYEALLHAAGIDRFMLALRGRDAVLDALREPRLERAIGVVYRPDTERQSHYFHARLPDQFDVVLHFDQTRAVEPLERTTEWTEGERGELPETYPSGI